MPNINQNTTPEPVSEKVNPPKPIKKKEKTVEASKAETPKKETKPRKPRARKVEELINEATKKMTDKEKDILIAFLRENSNELKNTIEALKNNITSAYEQCRRVEEQYESMEKYYKESLQYIDGQVIAFANAVRKSTVGGNN